jgi:ribosome-binding protein aMBF1 (putative translation factor)
MTLLDTSYHKRRLDERMRDPEFRREYEATQKQIAQVDAIVRELDDLRSAAGLSKAELARRIGKDPAAVRRLFSSKANPELGTVAALAVALDVEIKIVPHKPSRQPTRRPAPQKAAVIAET